MTQSRSDMARTVRHPKAARKPAPVERRRTPFDYEDTDWGREQERRHKENIDRFKKGDRRFARIERELGTNTGLTRAIKATLDDELLPLIKGVRVGRKVGKFAWGGALIASKTAKVGLFVAGCGAFVLALIHRGGFADAVEAFWKVFK